MTGLTYFSKNYHRIAITVTLWYPKFLFYFGLKVHDYFVDIQMVLELFFAYIEFFWQSEQKESEKEHLLVFIVFAKSMNVRRESFT